MIKCEKYLNINVSQHTEFIYKHKITNRNIGKYIIQKMKYQSQYHFADIQYCSYKSFSFKYDALLVTKYISYKSLYHSIFPEFFKTHHLNTTKSWFCNKNCLPHYRNNYPKKASIYTYY